MPQMMVWFTYIPAKSNQIDLTSTFAALGQSLRMTLPSQKKKDKIPWSIHKHQYIVGYRFPDKIIDGKSLSSIDDSCRIP
jgi:hypothetical protein